MSALAMLIVMKYLHATSLILRQHGWVALLIASLFIVTGCSNTMKATDALNAIIPQTHYTVTTASYGEHARQRMDVYVPSEAKQRQYGKKAAIVFVYGGAWREGNKEDYKFVGHALTELDHPVIIPDYQLFPSVRFPVFMEDIAQAIHYAEVNATGLLGRSMNEYVLMGHSAGAHTAALLTVDKRWTSKAGVRAKQRALVALAGPYDLPLDDPEVMPIFPDEPNRVNPVRKASGQLPPILLLHGGKDERVFPFHTQRFSDAIKRSGNEVQVKFYPRVNHVMVLGAVAAPLRLLGSSYTDIKAFLEANVANESP